MISVYVLMNPKAAVSSKELAFFFGTAAVGSLIHHGYLPPPDIRIGDPATVGYWKDAKMANVGKNRWRIGKINKCYLW